MGGEGLATVSWLQWGFAQLVGIKGVTSCCGFDKLNSNSASLQWSHFCLSRSQPEQGRWRARVLLEVRQEVNSFTKLRYWDLLFSQSHMLLSFTSSWGGRWVEATSFQGKGGWRQGKCLCTFLEGAANCLCLLHTEDRSGEDGGHWEYPFSSASIPACTAQPNTW